MLGDRWMREPTETSASARPSKLGLRCRFPRAAVLRGAPSFVRSSQCVPENSLSGLLRIDDLFDRSLRSIPSGSSVALYDRSSDEKDALYTVGDPAIEESGYRVDLPVNVADRPWLLRASIAPGEVERRMSTQPWAWFVAGLVTTWLASRTLRSQRAARDLLRNVLPRHIAERLTKSRRRVAERHDNVSVLFADIVGFTVVAGRLGADPLVR